MPPAVTKYTSLTTTLSTFGVIVLRWLLLASRQEVSSSPSHCIPFSKWSTANSGTWIMHPGGITMRSVRIRTVRAGSPGARGGSSGLCSWAPCPARVSKAPGSFHECLPNPQAWASPKGSASLAQLTKMWPDSTIWKRNLTLPATLPLFWRTIQHWEKYRGHWTRATKMHFKS